MAIKDELKGKTYTVPELSELLHISRNALYTAIKEGKLKTYRAGRSHCVTEKQLREYLERSK